MEKENNKKIKRSRVHKENCKGAAFWLRIFILLRYISAVIQMERVTKGVFIESKEKKKKGLYEVA